MSSHDECMEDRLGMLTYVEDWESLSETEQTLIRHETEQFKEAERAISLVQNTIGQALMIAVDNLNKGVSQKPAHACLEPVVPTAMFQESPAVKPQVPWANGVRVAGNYVRHAGEWKREALDFRSTNSRDPEITDFERRPQQNLTVLCDLLPFELADIVRYDVSYYIADRLQLTSADSCVRLFEEWRDKVNASS